MHGYEIRIYPSRSNNIARNKLGKFDPGHINSEVPSAEFNGAYFLLNVHGIAPQITFLLCVLKSNYKLIQGTLTDNH